MIVEHAGKFVLQLSGVARGIGTAAAGRYIEARGDEEEVDHAIVGYTRCILQCAVRTGGVGGREVRALGGSTKLNPHLGIPCSRALKPPVGSPACRLIL